MMDSEEDYWGASSVKKRGQKVNIFDDNVTVEHASDLAKYKKNIGDDEDEIETVGWDDTPITQQKRADSVVSAGPVISPTTSKAAPASSLPKSTFNPGHDPLAMQPAPPYMTHNRSRSDVIVGNMSKMSVTKSTSIPGNNQMSMMPNEPSISSLVSSTDTRSESRTPANRQEQEIQFLKQKLQLAQKGLGGQKLKIEDTIQRMITGQPFTLEPYKCKDEKLLLLDRAVKTNDGNAIIAVVIFLKRTLKEQLFHLELTRRPVAVDQYLVYLKAHYNLAEYERILGMLGRTDELAMLKYKQAASVADAKLKIDRLQRCKQAHFTGLEHDAMLIQQQIALLQRQRPIDVADDMTEKQGLHGVFRDHPRVANIVNTPVVTTLYYCCIYHYGEPDNLLHSPTGITKDHQLTEKQYAWTAVRARAKLRKWNDVEAMFTTKGWLGGTKLKCVIGFDKVAGVLHKYGAPSDVTAKYLKLVDDVEKRLELAGKLQCHAAVIETYLAQRDRRSLEVYQQRLKPNSSEWFYANDVLRNSSTKWKT